MAVAKLGTWVRMARIWFYQVIRRTKLKGRTIAPKILTFSRAKNRRRVHARALNFFCMRCMSCAHMCATTREEREFTPCL